MRLCSNECDFSCFDLCVCTHDYFFLAFFNTRYSAPMKIKIMVLCESIVGLRLPNCSALHRVHVDVECRAKRVFIFQMNHFYNYLLLVLQLSLQILTLIRSINSHWLQRPPSFGRSLHIPLTSNPPRKRSHPFSVIFSPSTAKNSLKFSLPNSVWFGECAANERKKKKREKENGKKTFISFPCVVNRYWPTLRTV